MRKRTLVEQMRQRAIRSDDTAVYTDKPVEKVNNNTVKTQVDNLYKRNDNSSQSLWDRVQARANNIMNTTRQAQEITKNYFNNSKLGQSINTHKNNFEEDKRNLKKYFGDTVQNTLTKGLNKNIKIDETRFINPNYASTQDKEDSSKEMLNIHSSEYMKSKALNKENNLTPNQLPMSIREYKKTDNSNVLLPKKENKETWGDKLSNISKKDVADTISYLPQVGKGVILGGKQALENMGQYYTETVPEQTNAGLKFINKQNENLLRQIESKKDISNIDNPNIGKSLFEIAKQGDQKQINSIIENAPNIVAKKLSELSSSTGQTLVGSTIGVGTAMLTGGAGAISSGASAFYFFGASGQGYFDDAKEKGMKDEDAFLYSGIMALWESASEEIVTGNRVNQVVNKITGKELSDKAMKYIGNEILENAVQEALTEPVNDFVTKITGGKEFVDDDLVKRMVSSGLDGALQGLLLGALTEGSTDVVKSVKDYIQKNGKETVINNAISDGKKALAQIESKMIEELDLSRTKNENSQISNSNISNTIEQSKLTDIQKQNLLKVTEKYNLSQKDVQDLITKTLNGEYEQNQQVRIENKQSLENNQQVNQLEDKTLKNQFSQIIQDNENNNQKVIDEKVSQTNYNNKENVKLFLKSASENKFDLNSKEIKTISKILDNRNLKGTFNSEIFNGDTNKGALYVNGDVVLNPNTDTKKGLYDLVLHETTHSLLENSTELKNTVLETLKSDSRYEQMYNDVASRYSEEYKNSNNFQLDVEEEMIADYLGENLSTEEFMTKLEKAQQTKNQNKIKQTIDNFIEKIKDFFTTKFGTSIKESDSEQYYWNKVQDLFYDAYLNIENTNNANKKYSKKLNGYFPSIEISTKDLSNYNIKNINNKYEVIKKLTDNLKSTYLSTEQQSKPITNIDTGIEIEIWKSGISETFGNDRYYKNLPEDIKRAKIASMNSLAKLIKYGEVRSAEASNYHNPNSKVRYSYLTAPITIDGKNYDITIDIRRSPRGENRFYIHNLSIKNEANLSQSHSGWLSDRLAPNNSIPQSNNNGNTNTKYSMPKKEDNTKNIKKSLPKNPKYSQNTIGEWDNYLKETSINSEKRKTIQELKLPHKKEIKMPQNPNKELENKTSSFNLKENNPTRHDVIQENRKIARENIKNISTWKDKKNGLGYQLETMERNMYDIIPDKEEAKKIIDTYFEPVHKREADKQRFINKYNDQIKEFKLNKYETEAVQLLGELKYNPSFETTDETQKILDNVNKNIQNNKIDKSKVDKAIDTFRKIYDELFEIENKALKEQGYKEKPYRKGYFPHFIDYVPETKTEKVLNKLGLKIDKRALPTDIAGITEQFVPGKTWNRSSLERKTNKTDFNALKGFDTYISQAADNIFHTENIQRLRGLENEIRYQYSDKGVQERIDSILNNDSLYQEEKQTLIEQIFEQVENPMPNLVVELRRYTNALANKKSEADRSTEQMLGRQFYSTINAIENRFAGNAVGLNIGSALTNFIAITQSYSQISTKNMGRATIDTLKSYIKNDGFIDNSTFLTNRLNQSDKLYKTNLEKVSEKANILFDVVDEISSNIIVRGKYLDNISSGMSEKEAIKNADRFGANVMADRSKGALPTKFEEKNPLTKAFTQFQLEVNNQYRYMIKDIPRDLAKKGLGSIALAYFKMFITAWLYNKESEELTGRKQAFSPIDLIKSSYDTIKNEELNTYNKITNIATEFGEQAPFIGGLFGGGRVPVNGALPNVANVTKAGIGLATGEMDSKKALNTLGKEMTKPVYYLLPPFGGGQIKKTVEGLKTVKDGGSYGIDDKGNKTLQFPVENKSAKDYIKAGVFGKYSLPKAKDYVANEFKSFNAKQTEVYDNSNIDYDEIKEYFDYSLEKGVKKKDKINHINTMKLSTDDKWNLYKYNIISDKERDDKTSQLTDAEYAIKNKLTNKDEYMKLYEKAEKSNLEFPDTDALKELKENKLPLKTYIDYKIKHKDALAQKKEEYKKKLPESKENRGLKLSDEVNLIKDYSTEEKRIIYSNYINKDDEIYNTLSRLEGGKTNIDEYLEYRLQDIKSDEDTKSNVVGKKVSKGNGTSKSKTLNYIYSSKMTDIEKAYIIETKYPNELSRKTRKQLLDLVSKSITDKEELEEVLKKFKDLEKHKDDGKWYWKK